MEPEILPCPFCGGEAERIDVPDEDDVDGGVNAGGSCIQCKRCAASTALHFDRKENLVSSWNERVVDRCEDCPPVGYPTDKTRCSECPAIGGEEPFPDYFELVSQRDTMQMRADQSAAERSEAEAMLATTIDDLMQTNTRANVFERQYRQALQDFDDMKRDRDYGHRRIEALRSALTDAWQRFRGAGDIVGAARIEAVIPDIKPAV